MYFWYLQSPKNDQKKSTLRQWYLSSSRIVFVHFLGELKTSKRHFEIKWPLAWYKSKRKISFVSFLEMSCPREMAAHRAPFVIQHLSKHWDQVSGQAGWGKIWNRNMYFVYLEPKVKTVPKAEPCQGFSQKTNRRLWRIVRYIGKSNADPDKFTFTNIADSVCCHSSNHSFTISDWVI